MLPPPSALQELEAEVEEEEEEEETRDPVQDQGVQFRGVRAVQCAWFCG